MYNEAKLTPVSSDPPTNLSHQVFLKAEKETYQVFTSVCLTFMVKRQCQITTRGIKLHMGKHRTPKNSFVKCTCLKIQVCVDYWK